MQKHLWRFGVNFYPRPPRGGRHARHQEKHLPDFISIHALREEGDRQVRQGKVQVPKDFYPRPPRGGRRRHFLTSLLAVKFLSTPSARRATPGHAFKGFSQPISIHALREEGDLNANVLSPSLTEFLSTPSARRATRCFFVFAQSFIISIHALREEGDAAVLHLLRSMTRFLSTPSARRATESQPVRHHLQTISIHALREEGD